MCRYDFSYLVPFRTTIPQVTRFWPAVIPGSEVGLSRVQMQLWTIRPAGRPGSRNISITYAHIRLGPLGGLVGELRIKVLWWGGSDPYHGVLVWSEHSNSWHSPRDRQSSILSQSFLSCCCPRTSPFGSPYPFTIV